jgi:hypothetical protein
MHYDMYVSFCRWDMLHRPIHGAGYLLSPAFMNDRTATDEPELMQGFVKIVEKLVPAVDHPRIMEELMRFREREGGWASPLIANSTGQAPLRFWKAHGYISPTLAKLAKRVLACVCTTAAAERNWSEHKFVHDPYRNRLRPDRAEMLVNIYGNSKLLNNRLQTKVFKCIEAHQHDFGNPAEEQPTPVRPAEVSGSILESP